jgi:hypothetical protein
VRAASCQTPPRPTSSITEHLELTRLTRACSYFDTAQASLADHTGSVIVEEFERLDAQLSAKIAAVAKSKTENPLELNGKPSNFYDDRQKTDSMLSELPEWLEFHVKAIKRALNGQGVHADRVAVLENALLYKCQELRSEFSGRRTSTLRVSCPRPLFYPWSPDLLYGRRPVQSAHTPNPESPRL